MENYLEPSWISEGNDNVEAITVEIWINEFPIRLICGYGPQESDRKERKEMFWEYVNVESQNASKDGAGLIIQMDGSSWAGREIIADDPNKQNQNGKFLHQFLVKNLNLSVVNALEVCEGKITKERHTKNGIERAILDFFIVCDKMLPLVKRMVVDEKGESALTK